MTPPRRRHVSGTNDVVERLAGRRRVVLLAAGGCALAIALAGRGEPSVALGVPAHDVPSYTLMQMNLSCGAGRLFGKAPTRPAWTRRWPGSAQARPDVSPPTRPAGRRRADARRTGYHLRFAGASTAAGRCAASARAAAAFGDAVLTPASVKRSRQPDFAASRDRAASLAVRQHPRRRRRLHRPPEHPLARRGRRATRRSAPSSRRSSPRRRRPPRHLRGRRQPPPLLRPRRRLDPHRRLRGPGPGPPARLRQRGARATVGGGVPADHTDHDVLVIRARAV